MPRLVPAFVDVEPDTFNIDVDGIEAMISPRTRAILAPNLIGNAPDWDRIRAIADAHGLKVIEDSCDALGATLRGTPTGTRSDISVTSFALAHVITAAATGGMVLLDDDELIDRCLLLRRWGRRSEPQFFGYEEGRPAASSPRSTASSTTTSSSSTRSAGTSNRARSAPRSATCSCASCRQNLARRQRNFDLLSAFFGTYPDVFMLPRQTEDLETGLAHVPDHAPARVGHPARPSSRSTWKRTASTRAWCGPATSPASPRSRRCRTGCPTAGCPNADRVMEQGLILPLNHGLDDDDIEYLCITAGEFLKDHGYARGRGEVVSAGGRFAGRRAVVTGASRGIGAGIAERLAAEGAAVAIVARTVEAHPTLPGSLTETADAVCAATATRSAVIAADLADGDDRARIVPEAVEQLGGPIDILVNNAAAAMYALPSEMPLKRRRITFEVNVARADRPRAGGAAGDARSAARAGSSTCRAPPRKLTRRSAVQAWRASPPPPACTARRRPRSTGRPTRSRTSCGAVAIRVNTVEPRAAVMSEGAEALAGHVIRDDQKESMEEMVEAAVYLCDCDETTTGQVLREPRSHRRAGRHGDDPRRRRRRG